MERFKKILPDPSDPVRDGLNDLVLQLATSFATK
jgi:hypothetical protein